VFLPWPQGLSGVILYGAFSHIVAAGNEADFAIKPNPPRHLVGYWVRTDSWIHVEDRQPGKLELSHG
jgi:hypothetical protein